MKRFILFVFLISLLCFIGCSNTTSSSSDTPTDPGTRTQTSETKSYPKLKVENKKANSGFIFLVELPNYKISPLEIRYNESMTFELTQGLWCYDNVTIMLNYGSSRNYTNYVYVRKNFKDGETTVVTLE